MNIPRRLIQTGPSSLLKPLAKAATVNLTLLHPEWEYLFFDDAAVADFVKTQFPEYASVFQGFRHPIQKVDFFRYLAVFYFGGFYFDLDVFLARPIDDLLENEAVFPFEELTLNRYLRRHHGMDWELGNYAFGAQAGNAFLKSVITNCVRAQRDSAWLKPMTRGIHRLLRSEYEVLNTTGPGLLSRTYSEESELSSAVTVLFPPDVRDPSGWHRFGDYGVHLMNGSWRSENHNLLRRIAWKWESFTKARLMPESHRLGPHRSTKSILSTGV